MTWVRVTKGGKDEYVVTKKQQSGTTYETLEKLFDSKIIVIKLPSDDYLIVRDTWKDFDNEAPNSLASILAKEPVYGDCMVLSPEEFQCDPEILHKQEKN